MSLAQNHRILYFIVNLFVALFSLAIYVLSYDSQTNHKLTVLLNVFRYARTRVFFLSFHVFILFDVILFSSMLSPLRFYNCMFTNVLFAVVLVVIIVFVIKRAVR